MKESRLEETNIYNRPLFFSIAIGIIELAVLFIVSFSLIKDPFELANTGFFFGAAFFSDVMNIFWGYVILTALVIVGLLQFYLGYNGIESDYPLIGKIVSIEAFLPIFFTIGLEFYYTHTVISAYINF